jgi:hypothetical protein
MLKKKSSEETEKEEEKKTSNEDLPPYYVLQDKVNPYKMTCVFDLSKCNELIVLGFSEIFKNLCIRKLVQYKNDIAKFNEKKSKFSFRKFVNNIRA